MKIKSASAPLLLLVSDLVCLVLSLWLALYLRALAAPSKSLFLTHITAFSLLFLVWIVGFYIAGLYDNRLVLRSRLLGVIANTHLLNSLLATAFFYLLPFYGITPKTVLFIFIVVSFVLVAGWRVYGMPLFGSKRAPAALVGRGAEMRDLAREVNANPSLNLSFVEVADLDEIKGPESWGRVVSRVKELGVSLVALDFGEERVGEAMPHLYDLIFSGVTFIDMHKLYEDVFGRVPLTLLRHDWFLENISSYSSQTYDTAKRLMDVLLASALLLVSLPFDLLAYIAIKLEDGGPALITQERVGEDNKLIKIHKFRTMTGNDSGKYAHGEGTALQVTRVGNFLRKSRIDEFPQFWNVLTGDLSLVGPRPELPSLMRVYDEQIPHYNIRHIIKPGLSGWAQINQENHPHHGTAVEETREKLSYDLYYVKHRSVILDVQIALRTVKTLFSRVGR